MRGLTPAERDVLATMCEMVDAEEAISDGEEPVMESLIASGRAAVSDGIDEDGYDAWIYTATPLGRLALRLWPATAATPGAGGR